MNDSATFIIKKIQQFINLDKTSLDYIFEYGRDYEKMIIEKIYEVAASIKKCELHVMKEIIFANYKKVFIHE